MSSAQLHPVSSADNDAELAALGVEIDTSFGRLKLAALEIVRFGALLRTLEKQFNVSGTLNSGLGRPAGTGLKGAVERFCKILSYEQARKYVLVADRLQVKFRLEDTQLLALCGPAAELDEAMGRKRERLIAFAEGHNLKSFQLELGLIVKPAKPIAKKIAAARAALARGEELVVACCHALSAEQAKWWAGLSNPERRAYNEWSDKLDFFEREKSAQSFLKLPARDREILKSYIRYFAEHLGIVRAPGGAR